jgi:glyoxalase family protein
MEEKINGIHHITVLASDPQQNYDYYTKILGLRFVKKTVNFDAPDVYHFYFSDEIGTPGTILTFFPFLYAKQGIRGNGEAHKVSFSIPKDSLEFWVQRLSRYDISFTGPDQRFGYDTISFIDPDGMKIELVEDEVEHFHGWETEEIPRNYSIKKFFGATVSLSNSTATEALVTDVMGFRLLNENGSVKRFISGDGDHRAAFDIIRNTNGGRAVQSAGSVHHIAWRTESDEAHHEWKKRLRNYGLNTTDIIDRNYFHSIYFREPGGVLFEIATDQPGFMIDEDKESLGQTLKLPPMYEHRRAQIEKELVPLNQ